MDRSLNRPVRGGPSVFADTAPLGLLPFGHRGGGERGGWIESPEVDKTAFPGAPVARELAYGSSLTPGGDLHHPRAS